MTVPSTDQALGGRAVSGLMWGVVGGLVGKAAGFLAQIYLGWTLSKEDFALYAIATSCMVLVAGLVNGGTQRVLIQRGKLYDELAYTVFRISLGFNVLAMSILAAVAVPVAHWFAAPPLAPMLAIMGVATVLSTPGFVLTTQLIGRLQFRRVQILAMCSHVVRHGSTVLFAFFGFGPFSFVLPVLVIAITDNLLAWKAVDHLPPRTRIDRSRALGILKDSRWVMVGTIAGALIQNGGNMAVGLVTDKRTLGVYFFAFQLTFALASLIGGTLQSTLIPTLTQMAGDIERQGNALRNATSAVAVAASGMAVVVVVFAAPVITLLWSGRWDEAIPVVEILALGLPALIASWVARAAIETNGGWATTTALSLAEGVGTLLAAGVGATLGGLPSIAIAVLLVKLASGVAHVAIAERQLRSRHFLATRAMIAAFAAAILAIGLGYAGVLALGMLHVAALSELLVRALIPMVAFAALARVACPMGVSQLVRASLHVWRRTNAQPAQ